MTYKFIPPPVFVKEFLDHEWQDWFFKLHQIFLGILAGLAWTGIDFTGSNLTDIETRNHNDLQNMQGGNGSTEEYHLTNDEHQYVQSARVLYYLLT